MERAVAQTIATAVHNMPSQGSSTTIFQASSAPNTIPNGSTKAANSEKPMDVQCDSNQPTTSNVTPTTPVKHANDVNTPKPSPAKSRSRSWQKKHGNMRADSRPKYNPADLEVRVEVSGYPTFAKAQDIHKVFSAYGEIKVEHVGRRYAVIAFESKKLARAALNDSNQLCLYGQFLKIKPFSGVLDEQKKQVFKSKHAVTTVEPAQLVPALVGSFAEQLAALLATVRLTQEEVTGLAALYSDLERVMQPTWPGCQAMPFGSITTGLGVKSSDADCFMNIPPQYRYGWYNFVHKARRILLQYPDLFSEVFAIPRANTPIVKLFHLPTKTHCDLTFKTPLGALNSKLVAFLLHADPRFLPLAVLIKYWASVHGITGSGRLTNYALTLMLIFYFQNRGLLPAVTCLQQDADPIIVDGWNTGFLENYERLPRGTDDASIDELLGGFFKFYDTFNFEKLVACPFLGCAIEKAHFEESTLPDEFQRYQQNVADNLVAALRTKGPVCVQDPFELCHNVASSVTPRMAEDIRAYFRFAAEHYEKEKANECKDLLRIILLEKPKLIRTKINPEYRVSLYPKMLDTIIHEDWKGTVKKAIFTVFEQMLKLKLIPTGQSETLRNGKERERYLTIMDKPLWKRKQFLRLYETVQMGFIEKHERITEEVLNVEESDWQVEFQVILTFSTKARTAWVSIRLTKGDMQAFFPFGKYFLSTFQSCVIGVLHASGDTSVQDNLNKLESLEAIDSNMINGDFDSDSVSEDDRVVNKPQSKRASEESQTVSEQALAGEADGSEEGTKGTVEDVTSSPQEEKI